VLIAIKSLSGICPHDAKVYGCILCTMVGVDSCDIEFGLLPQSTAPDGSKAKAWDTYTFALSSHTYHPSHATEPYSSQKLLPQIDPYCLATSLIVSWV
jgi:hypothetical protein